MRRHAIALALCAAALLAGCGDDGDDDAAPPATTGTTTTTSTTATTATEPANAYETTVLAALAAMGAFSSALEGVQGTALADHAGELKALHDQFDAAVATVAQSTPPAHLTEAHGTLLPALTSAEQAMLALSDAAAADDPQAFLAADAAYVAAAGQLADAAEALERAGA